MDPRDVLIAIPAWNEQGSISDVIEKVKTHHPKSGILVVDDEVINQKIISEILKADGYEVEIAPDGIVALMKIAKGSFDVILSDIAMPNLDGYKLLEYIIANKIDIPLIFLSGHTSPEDETRGLRLGATDYIRKPIDKELLLARVEKIFD